MVTNYEKGRRNEYRCMRKLEKLGYYCMRSASSKGTFDIIAIDPKWNKVKLIQVKTNRRAGKAEIEGMRVFSGLDWDVELWVYYDGKRQPTVESIV